MANNQDQFIEDSIIKRKKQRETMRNQRDELYRENTSKPSEAPIVPEPVDYETVVVPPRVDPPKIQRPEYNFTTGMEAPAIRAQALYAQAQVQGAQKAADTMQNAMNSLDRALRDNEVYWQANIPKLQPQNAKQAADWQRQVELNTMQENARRVGHAAAAAGTGIVGSVTSIGPVAQQAAVNTIKNAGKWIKNEDDYRRLTAEAKAARDAAQERVRLAGMTGESPDTQKLIEAMQAQQRARGIGYDAAADTSFYKIAQQELLLEQLRRETLPGAGGIKGDVPKLAAAWRLQNANNQNEIMLESQRQTQKAVEGMGKAGQFLTTGAISMAQNLPTMAISAVTGNPVIGLTAMGLTAAGQEMYTASAEGTPAGEAFLKGIASGGIEMLTEKIPLDNMMDILAGDTGRRIIKNVLRQMGTEATEEAVSYVLNYALDAAIAANNGEKAPEFSVWEMIEAALQGAYSGFVYGFAGSGAGDVNSTLMNEREAAGGNITRRILEQSERNRRARDARQLEKAGKMLEQAQQAQIAQQAALAANVQEQARIDQAALAANVQAAVPQNTAQVTTPIKGGLVDDAFSKRVDRRTRRVLNTVGEKLGVSIRFANVPNENGYYDPQKREIVISSTTTDPIGTVLSHEVTHEFETGSPEVWKQLRDITYSSLEKAGTLDSLKAAVKATYGDDPATMEHEIVAQYTQRLFGDVAEFEKILGIDRTLGQRLLDALDRILHKIGLDSRTQGTITQRMSAREVESWFDDIDVKILQQARDAWAQALQGDRQSESTDVVEIGKDSAAPQRSKPLEVGDYYRSDLYIRREEGLARKIILEAMGIKTENAHTKFANEIVRNVTKSIQENGYISQTNEAKFKEQLFENGRQYYIKMLESYQAVIEKLNETPIIVKNEAGGQKTVGELYEELSAINSKAFPKNVKESDEQMKRILTVAKTLKQAQITLKNWDKNRDLTEYYFDEAVSGLKSAIGRAAVYEDQRRKKEDIIAKTKDMGQLTYDEAMKLREEKQRLLRERKEILKNTILTPNDAGRIKGVISGMLQREEAIKAADNKQSVAMLLEVDPLIAEIDKRFEMGRKKVIAENLKLSYGLIATSNRWAIKEITNKKGETILKEIKRNGIQYSRETMERNIRDIVDDKELAEEIIATYFTPVHEMQAKATAQKKEYYDRLRALNLDTKTVYRVQISSRQVNGREKIEIKEVTESGLVQLYGEEIIDRAELERLGANVKKVEHAAEVFRAIYEEMYKNAQEALIRNGYYETLGYKGTYFPHFAEFTSDNPMIRIMNAMGMAVSEDNLPASIAGLTDGFKPGKKWVGNFLRRFGEKTDYDALRGFELYCEPVLTVIYHTDNIQRLRSFENALRYKSAGKQTREQIDAIDEKKDISQAEKDELTAGLLETEKTHLSAFMQELREYTNILAGKKSILDRSMEKLWDRTMYSAVNAVRGRIGANLVGGNLSSSVTNFAVIVQMMGEVPPKYALPALWDTIQNIKTSDGFAASSTFLTNRMDVGKLAPTKMEKFAEAVMIPMQIADDIASQTVVRARYKQKMEEGLSSVLAMHEADSFAANLIADRSKGAKPTIFSSRNPILNLFTQFQIEVNNHWSYLFKDMPRYAGTKKKLAANLTMMFVATHLFVELFESLTGYKPVLDPIGIIRELLEAWTDDEEDDASQTWEAVKEVVDEIPIIGTALGGGRYPMGSIIPDMESIISAIDSKGAAGAAKVIGTELATTVGTHLLLPAGGNQLKKTVQGIKMFAEGGSFIDSADGEKARFFVEQTPMNALRSALFGQWSTPEAREYFDSGAKPLTAKQTAAAKGAGEVGLTPEEYSEAYKKLKAVADANKNGSVSQDELGEHLEGMKDLTEAQKAYMFENYNAGWKKTYDEWKKK